MKELHILVAEYLATRRALGASLEESEGILRCFVQFLERHRATWITTRLALEWASGQGEAGPARQARRLGVVRAFAHYASAADSRHEVPPEGLLPARTRRNTPYIYTDSEIADLIGAARELPGRTGLRSCTYATLLGLLEASGMRSSEPLGLDRGDVDLTRGVLTVRDSKFGKSRYIPVHQSTCRALGMYEDQRNRLCPHPRDPAFFLSEQGTRIASSTFRQTFVKLSRQVGLRGPLESRGPRLHDLRHNSESLIIPSQPQTATWNSCRFNAIEGITVFISRNNPIVFPGWPSRA
ncbi:MAG: tyrosine-type recombinase/integrase, partial [Bryobacterales bacterium]|nr:tyrosine-type recombinase/integrase [Bryobacterales bacterium]